MRSTRPSSSSKTPPDGALDELGRVLPPERLDLDLFEEVVPRASFSLPVFFDLDARDDRHQVLGEAFHEQASELLVDFGIVVVQLVHLVHEENELHVLFALLLEDLDDLSEIENELSIAVIRVERRMGLTRRHEAR